MQDKKSRFNHTLLPSGNDAVFLWTDLETTGLNGLVEINDELHVGQMFYRITQMALTVTGTDYTNAHVFEDGRFFTETFRLSESEVEDASDWVKEQHGDTILIECLSVNWTVEDTDTYLSELFRFKGYKHGQLVLAGNSIKLDYDFMAVHLPKTFKYLHYRMLDVTALKIFNEMILKHPKAIEKNGDHVALTDIRESMLELQIYKARAEAQ